jgi:hypothetical protein
MNTQDSNPYTPPVAAPPLPPPPPVPSPQGSHYYFRDGDFLVVCDGAELPNTCVRTNEPVDPAGWRKKMQITWCPSWVFITLLGGLLPLLIVMLIAQKKAKITYSLGTAARARILRRRGIGFGLLVLSLGMMAVGANQSSAWDLAGLVIFGGVVALIVSLVFFIIANPVKVVKFRDGWFRIKGCSKEFLATLPVQMSPF